MNIIAQTLLVSIAALNLVACKADGSDPTDDDASVKALGDLANGSAIGLYSCSGDQPILVPNQKIFIDTINQALGLKVKEYLTAIPQPMQQAFLRNHGAAILVSSHANILCGFQTKDPRQSVPQAQNLTQSCFLRLTTKSDPEKLRRLPAALRAQLDDKPSLIIVQNASTSTVQETGLLTFGFLHGQLYPRLVANDETLALGRPEAPEVQLQKRSLARAFLMDILNNQKFDLTKLEPMLGVGAARKIRSNVAAGVEDILAGVSFIYPNEPSAPDAATVDIRRRRFNDYVFAHAYDSMHCSSKTLADMQQDFTQTYGVFSQIDAVLLAGSQMMGKVNNSLALRGADAEFFLEDFAGADTTLQYYFPYSPDNVAQTGHYNDRNVIASAERAMIPNDLTNAMSRGGGDNLYADPLFNGGGLEPTNVVGGTYLSQAFAQAINTFMPVLGTGTLISYY